MADSGERSSVTSAEEQSVPRDQGRRRTIGYLAPNVSDGIGQARWHGVLDLARERDVNLICFPGSY